MENKDLNQSFKHFDDLMRIKKSSFNENRSNLSSSVDHSGNSDVDVNVNVQVDTMPIALSLLCISLANKQISRQEFESAVEELIDLTNRYKKSERERESRVKLFNENRGNRIWGS